MAGEIIQKTSPKQPGARRRKRRLGVRIDMTPMVDIAFLLLIFYMVTTVFTMPQAMQINLPPSDDQVPVRHLLTIRVDNDGRYWWNMDRATTENLPQMLPAHPDTPDSVTYRLYNDTLQALLVNLNQQYYDKLNTLLLIHREARYEQWVNVLDEIDVLERTFNAELARKLGVEMSEIPPDLKFSYRYAMEEWSETDDRIIKDALKEARGAEVLK